MLDFYPPLNFDAVFDQTVNERAIAKFGFGTIRKRDSSTTKAKPPSAVNITQLLRQQSRSTANTPTHTNSKTAAAPAKSTPPPPLARNTSNLNLARSSSKTSQKSKSSSSSDKKSKQQPLVRNTSNLNIATSDKGKENSVNKSRSYNNKDMNIYQSPTTVGHTYYTPYNNNQSYNNYYNNNNNYSYSNSNNNNNTYYYSPSYNNQYQRSLSKDNIYALRDRYLEPVVLRKLGQNEKIFHGQSDFARSYIYRAFIFTSEINLFQNIDLVYKAIDEWKRLHPLLRVRVVNRVNPETNLKEGYFAYATDEKQKSHENIKFLYYKSNSSKTCEDIWKLLVERETTLPIDGENGLLWRLSFLEVKNMSKSGHSNHLYALVLSFDHCIMDGRSSYQAILQLFSIIEDMYTSSYRKGTPSSMLPSKEDMFRYKRPDNNAHTEPRYYLKAPRFLDMDNAIRSTYIPLKYLTYEEESNGMIYTHDGRPYVTVRDLVNISKTSNSKFRTLVINKTDLSVILKRCKENGVKLTTFLNMCLIMALRRMYERYGESVAYYDNEDQIINYSINISLREFPEYQAYNADKNTSVGCYIGLSFNSFRDRLSPNDFNWTSNFWYYARRESNEFHRKLDNGEFINSIHLPSKKRERDEFFYHFGNSNLGVLPQCLKGKRMIKVKQTFATSKYSRENFLCWFSNLIATIDGQLCWTISYNTSAIKQEIITQLIENLTRIIKDLMQS